MITKVYLIRHAGPYFRTQIMKIDHSFQITNEKYVLSTEGERKAKILSKMKGLGTIDSLYSSHYVRAMETAKYIAERNHIPLFVDSDLGERKVGIAKYEEMPEDFYNKQKDDPTYKIGNGENQIEVRERMTNAINEIINSNKGKEIAIVTHSTALLFYLQNWCILKKRNMEYSLEYKGNILYKGKMNSPEIFVCYFNETNLESLEKITPKVLCKK